MFSWGKGNKYLQITQEKVLYNARFIKNFNFIGFFLAI